MKNKKFKTIIILRNGRPTWVGNAVSFADRFFTNVSVEGVVDFCKSHGLMAAFSEEDKLGNSPVIPMQDKTFFDHQIVGFKQLTA